MLYYIYLDYLLNFLSLFLWSEIKKIYYSELIVERYNYLLSLSKIAHQMWRDHLFSQRIMTTERAVVVGVEADRDGGKIWKREGEVGSIGRGIFIK